MKTWMMALLLIAVGLLLAGCFGSPDTAPDYRPPNAAPSAVSAPAVPTPSGAAAPSAPAPSAVAPAPGQPSSPQAQPPADNASANGSNAGAPGAGACASESGSALTQCQTQQAIGTKDVTACTALVVKDERFKCITSWCASASRDYKQCDNLKDNDDNLACRNKCNPNSNT